MSVRVFAPAKINLTLEVGAPRADGYHPLQSAVVFASEGDWVEASPSDVLTLEITGPVANALPVDENNLVLRAARLLAPRRGAALRLQKNLPIASGIGGGSSDAAAALIALNQVWSLNKSRSDLSHLAASLGADVPVCVHQHSAWITGVGEVVAPISVPPLNAVLVNPGKPMPTPPVFRRFDELGLGANFAERQAPAWATPEAVVTDIAAWGNALETPAVALMPELGDLLAALRSDKRTLAAALSGSGATCFAVTNSAADARSLATDLSARNREWWVRPTKIANA